MPASNTYIAQAPFHSGLKQMTTTASYFEIQCPDNDGYWAEDASNLCAVCKSKLRRDVWNADFSLKKTQYDLSITYDGFYIASEKFRALIDQPGRAGVSFRLLPSKKKYLDNFYLVDLNNVVSVDIERAQPEIGPECGACGQCTYVVGAVGYFLSEQVAENDLVRTDLQFGDGFEKHFVMLAGRQLARDLNLARLNGCYLSLVEAQS